MAVQRNHRARRLALQALCSLDVQGRHVLDLVNDFIDDSREPAPVLTAARALLLGTYEQFQQVDRFLTRHARHWDLGRLAMVDRNILRLATFEMLQGKTPFKVVISEALLLAKEFSTAESPRFVNGVLDAVAREIAKDISPPSADVE